MKTVLFYLFLFFGVKVSNAQIPQEIQDSQIIGINKLQARTAIWPSPTLDDAKHSDYENSVWVKSLNGQWSFHWSPDPQSRPVGFYKPGFSRKGWQTIEVPSTIERQGFGVPLYTNSTGMISEYTSNGHSLIKDKVRFNFWRA